MSLSACSRSSPMRDKIEKDDGHFGKSLHLRSILSLGPLARSSGTRTLRVDGHGQQTEPIRTEPQAYPLRAASYLSKELRQDLSSWVVTSSLRHVPQNNTHAKKSFERHLEYFKNDLRSTWII